jgi:peptide-methionine (R)-S-oxide reductase
MAHDYTKNSAAVEALSPEQDWVTQEKVTERPFTGKYWDNHEPGITVDVVTGEPLFASVDKFDSGTGWPSFTKLIDTDNVVEKRAGRQPHVDPKIGDAGPAARNTRRRAATRRQQEELRCS